SSFSRYNCAILIYVLILYSAEYCLNYPDNCIILETHYQNFTSAPFPAEFHTVHSPPLSIFLLVRKSPPTVVSICQTESFPHSSLPYPNKKKTEIILTCSSYEITRGWIMFRR